MSQTPYAEADLPDFSTETYGAPSADDTAVEEDDLPELTPEPAEDDDNDDDTAAEAGTATGARTAAAAKPNRAFIRKIAAKALEIETSADSVKSMAAALLGSGEDTVELTAAVMTAGRTAAQPLADITEVLEALADEPWSAGIIAAAMDAGRQKAVWSVLQSRGTAGSTALPKAVAKAATSIVKAIHGLDEDDKSALAAAGELLKRS